MTGDELIDRLKFAIEGIKRRTSNEITVKVLVNLGKRKNQASVVLNVTEVGFDENTATIFLEV